MVKIESAKRDSILRKVTKFWEYKPFDYSGLYQSRLKKILVWGLGSENAWGFDHEQAWRLGHQQFLEMQGKG